MALVKQLHLPHSQPLKLIKMSEEGENRFWFSSELGVGDGAPVEMDKESVFERVDGNVVVRMLQMSTGCVISRGDCVEVIIITESIDTLSQYTYNSINSSSRVPKGWMDGWMKLPSYSRRSLQILSSNFTHQSRGTELLFSETARF